MGLCEYCFNLTWRLLYYCYICVYVVCSVMVTIWSIKQTICSLVLDFNYIIMLLIFISQLVEKLFVINFDLSHGFLFSPCSKVVVSISISNCSQSYISCSFLSESVEWIIQQTQTSVLIQTLKFSAVGLNSSTLGM